jgi:hypothetical protein
VVLEPRSRDLRSDGDGIVDDVQRSARQWLRLARDAGVSKFPILADFDTQTVLFFCAPK